MNIELIFNNKSYEIPKDLQEYLASLNLAENIKTDLCDLFIQKALKVDTKVVEPSEMDDALKRASELFVQRLCEKGVYDKTIDDYTFQNEGYIDFLNVTKNAIQAMAKYLSEEAQSYEEGKYRAEQNALSSVTGSGVHVYSSSILTLALTSAVEYTALQGQCNKADEQYANELKRLRQHGASERKHKEYEYFKGTYCPQAKAALEKFAYSLLGRYLDDLIFANQFDEVTLQYIDLKHSQDILKNLKLSSNKDAVLEKAFLACPYNIDVYIELAMIGKLDAETFKTASLLGQAEYIKNKLYALFENAHYTGNLRDDLLSIDDVIDSLSNITGKKKVEFYKEFAKPIHEEIRAKYKVIKSYASDATKCQDLLANCGEKILAYTNDDLKPIAEQLVGNVISDEEFNAVVTIGGYSSLLRDISPSEKSFHDKQSLDIAYITRISENLSNILPMQKKKFVDEKEKQNKEQITKLHELQKKKTRIVLSSIVLLILPFVLMIAFGMTWQKQNENNITSHIETRMKASKATALWRNVGRIEEFRINKVSYYKSSWTICMEPDITYIIGNNDVSASDVEWLISDYYYEYKQYGVPFFISIFNRFLYLQMGKVTIQTPNGQETVIFNGTTNPERYGMSRFNPCFPTPLVVTYILYAIIIGFRLWLYMGQFNSLERKYK